MRGVRWIPGDRVLVTAALTAPAGQRRKRTDDSGNVKVTHTCEPKGPGLAHCLRHRLPGSPERREGTLTVSRLRRRRHRFQAAVYPALTSSPATLGAVNTPQQHSPVSGTRSHIRVGTRHCPRHPFTHPVRRAHSMGVRASCECAVQASSLRRHRTVAVVVSVSCLRLRGPRPCAPAQSGRCGSRGAYRRHRSIVGYALTRSSS